jgi:hypothetical protein
MKSFFALATLSLLATSAFGNDFIRRDGDSILRNLGQGRFALVIQGASANKIFSDMNAVRAQAGKKVGNDIVCENANVGRGNDKKCTIVILDTRVGSLLNGAAINTAAPDRGQVRGAAQAYHPVNAPEFGVIQISGGMGSPAQLLWSNLNRSTRSGLGNQKAGDRYTCDRYQDGTGPVTFSCDLLLEKRTDGTIGLGAVG